MKNQIIIFVTMFVLFMFLPVDIYAEHVLDIEAFGQYLDISQLEADKITFEFDEKSYDVYYGYHGSLDAMGTENVFPVLSSMIINQENKSIDIIMESVPETTDFWVRIPDDVLYAENEKFTVLIDGVDVRYDLMKFPTDHVVGFLIDKDTTNIEIVGTRVIPEFGTIPVLILGIAILGLVYFTRKSPFSHTGL